MVWPLGWVCHAVRAPGVKWTLLAARRDGSDGVAGRGDWFQGPYYGGYAGHEPAGVYRLREAVNVGPALFGVGCGELAGDVAGYTGSRSERWIAAQVDGAGGDG